MIDPLHTSLAAPPAPRAPFLRLGTISRKPWVPSSASADIRHGQAIFYLVHSFDHKAAFERDLPTMIFAKVVCNLRNYYLQDQESTVDLIQTYFNPKCWDEPWSPEAVRLMWEYVEPFTPSLGLADEKARAKQRKRSLEDEVIDLLAWVKLGGRVLDDDLLRVFHQWNPHLNVKLNSFTRAVNAVTGMTKLRSDGKDYWIGFSLPTAAELGLQGKKAA